MMVQLQASNFQCYPPAPVSLPNFGSGLCSCVILLNVGVVVE